MCGIAGYIQRADDGAAPPPTLVRMTDRLRHRGPDGQGDWRGSVAGWEIALGHRRLSIIDLAGGAQPLGNEDGSVLVTFNGEIYNFQILQRELESLGHHFRTRCDTEVLVHLHEQQGAAGLSRLDGMFAFAIWDGRKNQLLLARDRAGIKPLYYAPLSDGGIAFASELTALLEHPQVDRSLDPEGLAGYFFSDYAPPPHTLVKGAKKLEPGHFLTWSLETGLSESQPFWSLAPSSGIPGEGWGGGNSMHSLSAVLRDKLEASVEAQMISDVPIGVFLSGGIDSSFVAALAQRHAKGKLQTFSIAFQDPQFDESAFARQVASHIGSMHIERTLAESDLLTTLDRALDCLDEPMADPSILPTYLLSKLASEQVKVVLGGDGGDELWAGYPTYRAHQHAARYARIPRLVRAALIEPVVARLPVKHGYQTFEWKAKRFALRWDDDPARRHMRWMSSTDLPDLKALLPGAPAPPQWQDPGAGRESAPFQRCFGNGWDALGRVLAMDFSGYLPGSVLAKVDRAAMAHSLEVRPPMLGNDLIDFAFSIPPAMKLQSGITKALLKSAAAGILPNDVIFRRKKGFAIPLARWLNGPLRPRIAAMLESSPMWETKLLNRETARTWASEHARRRIDRSKPLWAMLVLHHWMMRTM
jgi:asparagine synthase (glutamine-hydrolysing)